MLVLHKLRGSAVVGIVSNDRSQPMPDSLGCGLQMRLVVVCVQITVLPYVPVVVTAAHEQTI